MRRDQEHTDRQQREISSQFLMASGERDKQREEDAERYEEFEKDKKDQKQNKEENG